MKITTKFNRCIEFTLPDGRVITAKVLGDKVPAAADAKRLVAALIGADVAKVSDDLPPEAVAALRAAIDGPVMPESVEV